jgi:hypothetical protein
MLRAQYLKVKPRALSLWVRQGKVKAYKLSGTDAEPMGPLEKNSAAPPKEGPVQDLVIEVKEKVSIFGKFWQTRRAILRGEVLARKSTSELNSGGLFTAWKFNLLQSGISTIPALMAGKVLDTLFPPPKLEGFQSEFASWISWTLPATAPFLLFVLAQVAAWASLKRRDTNPQSKRIARSTYLYLDGAFGLYPQTLVTLGILLIFWHIAHQRETHGKWFLILLIVGIAGFATGSVWQLILNLRIIPRKIFVVNGYSYRLKSFWIFRDKGRNFGPLNKFLFAQAIGGWVAFAGVILVGYGLAAVIAFVVWRVKSNAGHY